jgi:hypothetical protein
MSYALIVSVAFLEEENTQVNEIIEKQNDLFIMIICISFYLPTVKLNTFPVIFLPFVLLFMTKRYEKKRFFTCSLAGLVLVLPFLLRNVVLSGYLVFPFPEIDCFGFDWKVPPETVANVRRGIRYFAYNPQPGAKAWTVAGMSTAELIRFWLAHNYTNRLNYWVAGSLLAGVLFFVVCLKRRRWLGVTILAIQGIVLGGIIYWFFTAPLYRFGKPWLWGCIMLSLAGLGYLLLGSVRAGLARFSTRVMLVLVCVVLLHTLLVRWDSLELVFSPRSELLWKVRALPEENVVPVELHRGLVVHVAPRETAWNADLPSSPCANRALRMRGKTLKEGFRIAE